MWKQSRYPTFQQQIDLELGEISQWFGAKISIKNNLASLFGLMLGSYSLHTFYMHLSAMNINPGMCA